MSHEHRQHPERYDDEGEAYDDEPVRSFYRQRMAPWDAAVQAKADRWRPVIAAALAEAAKLRDAQQQ